MQLSDLLCERNQLRDLLDNSTTNLKLERDELSRKLAATKQEILTERIRNQEKVSEVEAALRTQVDQLKARSQSQQTELNSVKTRNLQIEREMKTKDSQHINIITVSAAASAAMAAAASAAAALLQVLSQALPRQLL